MGVRAGTYWYRWLSENGTGVGLRYPCCTQRLLFFIYLIIFSLPGNAFYRMQHKIVFYGSNYPLKSDIWKNKLPQSHNLQTIFIFLGCHRIICSKIWAYWIITDLVHRSFCSSSEWWLRGIRLTWEFYYCKLNFCKHLKTWHTSITAVFLLY